MKNTLYQLARNFSKTYPAITDVDRRRQKGRKAANILKEVLRERRIDLLVDIGCSNAIFLDVVIEELQVRCGLGLDLDTDALPKPTSRRVVAVADALALPVADSSVDLILCNHTYEHVSNSRTLFQEITRVLKPNGLVYFGAMNSRWPIEPHFHLPFIHWLPARWSLPVMKIFGHKSGYSEKPLSTPKLRRLVSDFQLFDYTLKVIAHPERYSAQDSVPRNFRLFLYPIAKLLYGLLPGYLWVLVKPEIDREQQ